MQRQHRRDVGVRFGRADMLDKSADAERLDGSLVGGLPIAEARFFPIASPRIAAAGDGFGTARVWASAGR